MNASTKNKMDVSLCDKSLEEVISESIFGIDESTSRQKHEITKETGQMASDLRKSRKMVDSVTTKLRKMGADTGAKMLDRCDGVLSHIADSLEQGLTESESQHTMIAERANRINDFETAFGVLAGLVEELTSVSSFTHKDKSKNAHQMAADLKVAEKRIHDVLEQMNHHITEGE